MYLEKKAECVPRMCGCEDRELTPDWSESGTIDTYCFGLGIYSGEVSPAGAAGSIAFAPVSLRWICCYSGKVIRIAYTCECERLVR